ncbi:MAG TPA: filamentous hemagglutinin N-terminal domain-containing protein, partial [Acetobacteraceae bacterium]|nr:filamentous hemagglutinin N-terminal domain-containing protein [Acetobacteraceae bacterium]
MEAIQVSQGMKMGRRLLLASTAITLVLLGRTAQAQMPPPDATPQGGTVVGGAASIARAPGAVTITQSSPRAAIDWRSFNVGAKARVTFRQPDARAIALNRVVTDTPSVIAGRIDANGQIVLMNQSGVIFTRGSQVNAESLVISTSGISARNFMAGHLDFTAPPRPGARIVNRGRITMKQAGLAAFVAPQVVNRGVVTARLGHVILAGASAFTLDLQGDRLISLDVTRAVRRIDLGGRQVDALVTNQGTIIADGGSVTLSARAVDGLIQQLLNVGGTIRADNLGASAGTITIQGVGGDLRIAGSLLARGKAAGEAGGTIGADASGTVRLTRMARIDASGPAHGGVIALGTEAAKSAPRAAAVTIARGAMVTADATRAGAGGSITVLSRERTVEDGALSARGIGGAGGRIETSSDRVISISGTESVVSLGGRPGEILLDPATLVIAAPGDRGASAGIASTSGGGTTVTTVGLTAIGTSYVDPAMLGGLSGTVILDAARLISVQSALDMPQASAVTLNSGGDISVAAQISLAGSLEIDAGRHIAIGAPVIGGAVGLSSRNGVAETGGGLIETPLLGSAGTIAGGLDLAGPNVIGTIGNIAISGGNAAISSTGTMAIAGTLSDPGGLVSLSADALDEGETGAIDAGSGSLALAGGSALLASPFNRFATLAGARLSGSFDLADRAPLVTSGAVSAHDATFSAAGLVFDAPVSTGTLALSSSAGVSQGTGGAIDAETLTSGGGTIAGNALLGDAANNIGTLSNFTVAGDAMVETSGVLRLEGAVDIAGALALGAPGGLTEAGTASLEAATLSGIGSFAGPVSLAGGNDIATLGGFDTGDSLLLRDGTSLEISEPVTASSIALIDAGTLDLASSLSVTTGGSVGLTADGMTDAGGTIMAPGGMVSLVPLSPGRPVVIGGTDPDMLDLSICLLQTAGDAATLALGSTDSGPLTVAAPADLAVPDIILRGGGIALDAALGAPDTLDLESTAGITQRAAFSAQALTGSASGMVLLGMPNLIGTLQGFSVPGQTFLLRDRAGLSVSGPVGAENIGLDAAS